MSEFYFSVNLDNHRTLCVAPLTDRRIAMSGQDIEDSSGYFLFERRGTGESAEIEILAQAVSEDAAHRLREMFEMT
jgi:hypothetical protein